MSRRRSGFDWIEGKLRAWGDWQLIHRKMDSFPKTTLLYRAFTEGLIAESEKGHRVLCPDMPESVWATHRAFLKLSAHLRNVIVVKYLCVLHADDTRWTDNQRAKLLRVSRDKFRDEVREAKHRIEVVWGDFEAPEVTL